MKQTIHEARGTVFEGIFLPTSVRTCDRAGCGRQVRFGTNDYEYLCQLHFEDGLIAAARAALKSELLGTLEGLA